MTLLHRDRASMVLYFVEMARTRGGCIFKERFTVYSEQEHKE